MRSKERLVPILAAGALFSGVGAETPGTALAQETKADTAELNPTQRTLNDYRNRLILKHQARVLLDTCVAWNNAEGGTTVTWNPGVALEGSIIDKENRSFYIFSTHDPRYKPTWGPLNGPPISSKEASLFIFKPKHKIKGGVDRRISKNEYKGKNGTRYYRDIQTGEPVINTLLYPELLDHGEIAEVCVALRDDKKIDLSHLPKA